MPWWCPFFRLIIIVMIYIVLTMCCLLLKKAKLAAKTCPFGSAKRLWAFYCCFSTPVFQPLCTPTFPYIFGKWKFFGWLFHCKDARTQGGVFLCPDPVFSEYFEKSETFSRISAEAEIMLCGDCGFFILFRVLGEITCKYTMSQRRKDQLLFYLDIN